MVFEGPHRMAMGTTGYGRRPVSEASSTEEKKLGRAPKEGPRPASFTQGKVTSSSCPCPSSRTSLLSSSPFLYHLLRLRPTLNRRRSRPRMRSRVLSQERRFGASRAHIHFETIYLLLYFFHRDALDRPRARRSMSAPATVPHRRRCRLCPRPRSRPDGHLASRPAHPHPCQYSRPRPRGRG